MLTFCRFGVCWLAGPLPAGSASPALLAAAPGPGLDMACSAAGGRLCPLGGRLGDGGWTAVGGWLASAAEGTTAAAAAGATLAGSASGLSAAATGTVP